MKKNKQTIQDIYNTLALLTHRELCELLSKILWQINHEGEDNED